MKQSIVIWRLTDGKQGHERQTEGLAKALASRVTVEVDTIAVPPSRARGFMELCLGTFHRGAKLPTLRGIPPRRRSFPCIPIQLTDRLDFLLQRAKAPYRGTEVLLSLARQSVERSEYGTS